MNDKSHLDVPPSNTCYCGGYIGWQELPDRWEGSCYGACGSYVTKLKIFPIDLT